MTYVIDYTQPTPAGIVSARFEVAFAARWYTDLTDPAVVWTDLRGRFLAADNPTVVSWSRGRSLSSGDMARTPQPGSLSVRLDSADGALTPDNPASPYYPNVAPGLPVRWSVFDGSSWRVEFTGFVTDVNPAMLGGVYDWTQVDLTATDGWSRIAQAGVRLAYRDRVLTDLAAPRDVSLLLDDTSGAPYTEMLESTGLRLYASGSAVDARDAWGVGVWRLDAGGTLDWSTPGAAGVLAEIGRGYTSGSVGASTTSLACDRYGGSTQRLTPAGTVTLSTTCASQNTAAQQIGVARLPVQLLPASAYDPTSVAASGWTISGGGSLAVGGGPAANFVASRFSYDPATSTQTPIVDGPAHTLVLSGAVSNSTTVLSPTVPVTAGKQYAAHLRVGGGHIKNFTLQFLDASGAVVGSGGGSDWSASPLPLVVSSVGTAPATAVSARIFVSAVDASVTFHAPGIYACPGDVPARWWPAGMPSDLQLFAQWPIVSGGNVTQWLHFRASVAALADGQPHLVAWNRVPGVGGVPALWVDGAPLSGTWEASTTSAYPFTTPRNQIGAGTGTTAALTVAGPHAPMTTDPAKVTTFLAITGAPRATSKPSQALVTRWVQQYGSPALWPQATAVTGTTDVLMGSLLDGAGWPKAMRALQTGKASTTLSWARLAWGTDGSAPSPPGDYSSDITALAEAEFGWADVDGAGNLRWLPRRWYDPGTGTATATLHLTYQQGVADAVTYTTALTQQMGEADVINQVWVSLGGVGLSVPTTLLEDFDSQDRLGIRRGEFTNNAWSATTDTDAVANEVLSLYGSARLVASTVTVRCYGATDPNLAAMLASNPASVVVVTVPRAPAADMDLSCLVTQVAATTDGLVTEFTLTLSPCPVPALFPLYPGAAVFPAVDLYPAGA